MFNRVIHIWHTGVSIGLITWFNILILHPSASRGMGMGVIKTWSSFMKDSHPTPPPTIPHRPTPLLADVLEYQYVETRGS